MSVLAATKKEEIYRDTYQVRFKKFGIIGAGRRRRAVKARSGGGVERISSAILARRRRLGEVPSEEERSRLPCHVPLQVMIACAVAWRRPVLFILGIRAGGGLNDEQNSSKKRKALMYQVSFQNLSGTCEAWKEEVMGDEISST